MNKLYFLLLTLLMAVTANAATASQLYLLGGYPGENWQPNNGTELTKTSEGVFELDVNFDNTYYFVFVTVLSDDWNTVNNNRYGHSNSGDLQVTVGNPITLKSCSNNSMYINAGSYHFKVDTNTNTFTATKVEQDVHYDLYLRSDQYGWNIQDNYKFTYNKESNTYTLKVDSFEGGKGFKIAGDNYRPEFSNGSSITLNAEKVLFQGGNGNASLGEDATNVEFILSLDDNNDAYLQITGTPAGQVEFEYPELYLRGEINEWTASDDYKFILNEETGIYTLSIPALSGKFKIASGEAENWKYAYGNYTTIVPGQSITVNNNQGNEITSPRLTDVEITLKFGNGTDCKLTVNGTEVLKTYTFFVENISGWTNVKAYVWRTEGTAGEREPLGSWNGAKNTLSNTIVINNKTYFVGSFQAPFGISYGIKFHNGEGAQSPKDLVFEDKGFYTTTNYNNATHSGAVIFGIESNDVVVNLEKRTIEGSAKGKFKIKVNTTEHHTVHYLFTPNSPAAAPARDAADYSAYTPAENGEIEVPATSGSLNITTHDGASHATPMSFEVNVSNTTGIEDITVEGNEAVEYYNLQGVRVANPSNGLYIVRCGNTATKQYIR